MISDSEIYAESLIAGVENLHQLGSRTSLAGQLEVKSHHSRTKDNMRMPWMVEKQPFLLLILLVAKPVLIYRKLWLTICCTRICVALPWLLASISSSSRQWANILHAL